MLVRDMDLDVPVTDNRRLEVVVDGFPLRGGAVDTTLVCALHADDTPRRGAAASDGVALKAHSRAKLVVEVGGKHYGVRETQKKHYSNLLETLQKQFRNTTEPL